MTLAIRQAEHYLLSVGVLLFVMIADSVAEQETARAHAWVEEARRCQEGLAALARDTPEIGTPPPDNQLDWLATAAPHTERLFDTSRKGDQLLWKLWLVTGQPPQPDRGESLQKYLQENAALYGEYIQEHADLSDEAIVRLGLLNCIEIVHFIDVQL